MDDADDFLAQQRAKLAGMAQAAQVAEMNIGLAQNLQQRMAELDAMAAEAMAPTATEMTSWEAEQRGVRLPAAAPPAAMGGTMGSAAELVLCQVCWDVPCACGRPAMSSAASSAADPYLRGGPRSPAGAKARPPAEYYAPEPEPAYGYGGTAGYDSGGYGGGGGGGRGMGAPRSTREPSLESSASSRRAMMGGGAAMGGTGAVGGGRVGGASAPAAAVLCMACFDTHCKCPGGAGGGGGGGAPGTPRGAAALCPRCFDIPCVC